MPAPQATNNFELQKFIVPNMWKIFGNQKKTYNFYHLTFLIFSSLFNSDSICVRIDTVLQANSPLCTFKVILSIVKTNFQRITC